MKEEVIIGFDCKIWGPELLALWSDDRRSQYLLRPDVVSPLSVDEYSWPSVFDSGAAAEYGLTSIPFAKADESLRPNATYWDSLSKLEAEIRKNRSSLQQFREVVVLECLHQPTLDSALPSGFVPLGYDVAGLMLVSSLSNCGYHPDEQAQLMSDFAAQLGDYHLFSSWSEARDFAVVSNKLVPEHAPFAPYLLAWRLNPTM